MCTVIPHMFHFSGQLVNKLECYRYFHDCAFATALFELRGGYETVLFPFRKYRQSCRANWHAEVYKQEISGGVRFLYQNIYRTDWLEVARQFCRKPGTSFTFHAQLSWNFGATIPKRRSCQFLFTINRHLKYLQKTTLP